MEIGVSGAKLLASRAKSLLTCGRTEQINRYIVVNGNQDTYCQSSLSRSVMFLFETPWTVAHQAPWNSPGDLPDPGLEPRSPAFREDSLSSEPPGKPSVREGSYK